MLLKYNVSNFKSIGHSIEFSMFPVQTNTDERFLKTINTRAGEWKVLQRGGFFGPNASGKSSFIESMAYAKKYIVSGQKSGKGTGINQFKGNFEELKGISTFQFVFYLDGEVYDYGFSLDNRQVHEEWLMILSEKNFEPMFTRVTDANEETQIDIEVAFAQSNHKERTLAEVLKEGVQKNQLFLYKMYDNGIKRAEELMEWFKSLQIIFPGTKVQGLPIRMQKDIDFKIFVAESLRKLDTGVFDINVVSDDIDFHDFAEKVDLPKEVVEHIEEIKSGIININGKYFIFAEGDQSRTILVQLQFEHRLNGRNINFNIDDESDGTQRLLDLLPMLFAMGENNKAIYFVDEIDRSLHTKLSQYFLNEFVCNCEDKFNQIIFTAHDVNLINLSDFRQEEIWFIEKNSVGESKLKPLSNFKIEKEQDTLKAYLNGRFGAIPMIRREC